jgi:hypothetical protein
MPQKTNLNISPYFDDFDKNDNFYRVLFKPGYPVQARELTNLQSILQNQIESFGSHIFKEGSMVIPGSVTYDNRYFCVKVNPDHLGIDITVYLKDLIGKRVKGQDSGIIASIKNYTLPPDEGIEDITIYIKYLDSGNDFQISQFPDGEILILEENITYGNTTINSGDTILTVLSQNATAVGSAVGLDQGVYFIRGTFVDVQKDQIVLEPYSTTPSYRVGLNILEEIVTANDDTTLNDNARGFSNYAAPGADRFKISVNLTKKSLDDFEDTNFVELVRVDRGEIKKLQNATTYSEIQKYLAKRTFEESGNYAIDPFTVDVLNSLNDEISSQGVYVESQKTEEGNTPSDDLMCVRVSPGRAYVKGFDVSLDGSRIIDVPKPRTTKTINEALIPFEMGNRLKVNNVYGTPIIGLSNTNTIKLYNKRRNTSTTNAGTGTQIGEARIYSFGVSDAPYSNATTEWDLYLFDVQTYTALTLSLGITGTECPATSYVRGLSSGASGYVVSDPSSTLVTLTQTSGNFLVGEQIIINENLETTRNIQSVTAYTTSDIKSVYQDSNGINASMGCDFIADTVLYRTIPSGFNLTDRISVTTGGIVTCPGRTFLGIKIDSIIRYQKAGSSTETFNRVSAVAGDGLSMTVVALDSDVSGICDKTLPSSATETTTFSIGNPQLLNVDKASLYTPLPKKNISSVGLDNSNLLISSQVTGKSTNANGQLTVNLSDVTGITSAFFEAYDAEKYSVHYSNGTIAANTSSQFSLGSNGGSVTFTGLTPSQSNVSVNVTLKKSRISSKSKNYIRSEKLVIDKTSGVSTVTSGLTTSKYYGLRVEDAEISLNLPDVANVIAIYQSIDTNQPILDKLTFVSGLALDTNTIVGEKIIGSKSRAIGQLVTRSSPTEIEFVYLNSRLFEVGETVTFKESNIETNIQGITKGSYLSLTSNYTLDKGQKDQYCDYSKLVRTQGGIVPSKQLLAIFNYYQIQSGNSGDIFTVNSYTKDRFTNDIPLLSNNLRATDTLDFRPRVSKFTSTSASPFAFSSRSFESTVNYIITPNESSLVGYSYYLPRIDKVTLNKLGQVSVIVGAPAEVPAPPADVDDAMDLAEITLPAYLYDPKVGVNYKLYDNRRFTMRDIAALESRIKNIEINTSLNLLELDTQSLQIQDADGLSRFKTGFIADDFKNLDLIDTKNADVKCDVDTSKGELISPVDFWSINSELALDSGIDRTTADYSTNLKLLDPNTRKTGDLITLNYEEVGWLEQPQASNVENVNPFNVIEYVGGIFLDPAADNWVRTIYVDDVRTESTGAQWVEKSNTATDVNVDVQNIGGDIATTTTTTRTTSFTNVLEGPSREFTYVESVKISGDTDPWMRSRNVYFATSGLKPFTQHYHYLDKIANVDFVPKLMEIEMISGTFQVDEIVRGHLGSEGLVIRFICRAPNHKQSIVPELSTSTYTVSPYDRTSTLGTSYSPSSTVLNVGARLLATDMTNYGGFVVPGVILSGESSGAVARVTNVRLITDNYGDLVGTFFIRDANLTPPPPIRIQSGQREFKITAAPPGITPLPGSTTYASNASTTYSGSGVILHQNTNTVNVRNPPKPSDRPSEVDVNVDVSVERRRAGKDPLAQSFTVDETGAFLTGMDVYFATKDPNAKLFVEIRTVELGTPTNQLVQDYARTALEPNQINVSSDASVPTRITFPSPIYLESGREYAAVFLAPTSDLFEMWVGTMGKKTVRTSNLPDVQSVVVTKQYSGGSLFKSQNGTIWTASQYQDLTFKLYKAKFVKTGDVVFYNGGVDAGSKNVSNIPNNGIKTLPKKLKVGITNTSSLGAILTPGRKVGEGATNATSTTGIIEKIGGPINTLGVTTGIGYSGSSATYSSVPLYSISGNGSGALADITTNSSGTITGVSIVSASKGNGYALGDSLGVTTSYFGKGSGAVLTVSAVNGIDTLYLTNVQGESFTNAQDLIYYAGTTRTTSGTTIRGSSSQVNDLYSGKVFEVNQYNHGMHGANNLVKIQNVLPDTAPIALTANLGTSDTTISVASTTTFGTFEGISTARGYVLVENEVIEYTNISGGVLTIGTRGVNGAGNIIPHPSGSVAYSYQANGVSLTKINTTHTLPSNATLVNAKSLDRYYLEIDRGSRASGTGQLSFADEKALGGNKIQISQNHQFSNIEPRFNIITPGKGTTISSKIRTVSGTSAGGSEVSFIDQGYETVTLNKTSFLSTPRMVCSQINETTRLTTLPLNKSLTLRISLSSQDSNLSPVLDMQNTTFILGRNRINRPIADYTIDSRCKLNSGDPHSAVYITNRIDLQQPATSLKVLLSACRLPESDFRVLYKLFKGDSSEVQQSYILFPGYDNMRDTNGDGYGDLVIDAAKNTGRADKIVNASNRDQFLEYQFTAQNLDPFTGFVVKVVMTSSSESSPMRFKDFRAIALA